MNKFTIILLTSLLAFIQISNALPMHEAAAHREPIKDNAPESADTPPIDSNNSPDLTPNVETAADNENVGGEVTDEPKDKNQENGQEKTIEKENDDGTADGEDKVKNYRSMEHFLHDAIYKHMGPHFEFDSMSDETERELYDLFCDMEIIHADSDER